MGEFPPLGELGIYHGSSSFGIKGWEPPKPDTPTIAWVYNCPCGEQHRLATAVTTALTCGPSGKSLDDESRFETVIKPYGEVWPKP